MRTPECGRWGSRVCVCITWLAGAVVASGLAAQDEDLIFKDGFETGSDCRWDSAPECTCEPDVYEPNGSELAAANLGDLNDCADSSLTVSAVLADGADTDFVRYSGNDTFGGGCSVEPSVEVDSSAGARACVYFECNDGDESLVCPAGSTDATSPDGRPGCCSTGDMPQIDFECSGFGDDSASVYVRVDQAAEICTHYHLVLHF